MERIVDQQLREESASLFALQQHISDLTGMGNLSSFFSPLIFFLPHSLIPINHQKIADNKKILSMLVWMVIGTHRGMGGGGDGGVRCVIPNTDIINVDFPTNVKGEKIIRCKLATLYQLVDLFRWSQSIYNHNTVRRYYPPYLYNRLFVS